MNLIKRESTPFLFRPLENPFFREMEGLPERLGTLFGTWTRPLVPKEFLTTAEWTPAIDVQEMEKEYLVKVELPEIPKEGVKVTVENGILTIQGERLQEKEEKGKKYLRLERSYGAFLRTFTVPPDAFEAKITAEYKDGMLYVHLPKAETPRPKTIEVKVS